MITKKKTRFITTALLLLSFLEKHDIKSARELLNKYKGYSAARIVIKTIHIYTEEFGNKPTDIQYLLFSLI